MTGTVTLALPLLARIIAYGLRDGNSDFSWASLQPRRILGDRSLIRLSNLICRLSNHARILHANLSSSLKYLLICILITSSYLVRERHDIPSGIFII